MDTEFDLKLVEQQVNYGERDAILHALAVGLGGENATRKERPFVIDAGRTVPTLASALVSDGGLLEKTGYSRQMRPVVEELRLYRPLAGTANLLLTSRVMAHDEVAKRLELASDARPLAGGEPVFSLRRVYSRDSVPAAPELPSRAPDLQCQLETRTEQRLLARLVGQRDLEETEEPELFDTGSILGLACRAVLQTICEFDHTLMSVFSAHIVGPLAAGESLLTEMWQEANIVSFRSTAVERKETVLSAYAVSIVLLMAIVGLSLWRGRRVRAEMRAVERRSRQDG